MRENDRIKFIRVVDAVRDNVLAQGRADHHFHWLGANFYSFKAKRIPYWKDGLGVLLGCYVVRILPNMGSGKWLVYIWRLMATVALGLSQFGRFCPVTLV